MPRWLIPVLIILVLIVSVEIYTFQAFKTISKSKLIRFSYIAISVVVYAYFLITILTYDRSKGQTPEFQMAMGILLTFSIPKLVIVFVLFGEDMYRLVLKLYSAISSSETQSLVGRRKFIAQIALGLAAIPFASFIYGIIQGKYNYNLSSINI